MKGTADPVIAERGKQNEQYPGSHSNGGNHEINIRLSMICRKTGLYNCQQGYSCGELSWWQEAGIPVDHEKEEIYVKVAIER